MGPGVVCGPLRPGPGAACCRWSQVERSVWLSVCRSVGRSVWHQRNSCIGPGRPGSQLRPWRYWWLRQVVGRALQVPPHRRRHPRWCCLAASPWLPCLGSQVGHPVEHGAVCGALQLIVHGIVVALLKSVAVAETEPRTPRHVLAKREKPRTAIARLGLLTAQVQRAFGPGSRASAPPPTSSRPR
eukprot:SAG31_NODE_430_length_15792_cov_15.908558_1_plen_185_part_00